MKKTFALLRIWLWVSLITIIFGGILGIMSVLSTIHGHGLDMPQLIATAVLTYFIIYFINDHIKKES